LYVDQIMEAQDALFGVMCEFFCKEDVELVNGRNRDEVNDMEARVLKKLSVAKRKLNQLVHPDKFRNAGESGPWIERATKASARKFVAFILYVVQV
jgi:hypothetical protein